MGSKFAQHSLLEEIEPEKKTWYGAIISGAEYRCTACGKRMESEPLVESYLPDHTCPEGQRMLREQYLEKEVQEEMEILKEEGRRKKVRDIARARLGADFDDEF